MSFLPKLFLFFFYLFVFCYGSRLPTFLQACSRSQPLDQLTQCITNQARESLQIFARGLPEYGIEPFDPLSLPNIEIKAGTFNMLTSNITVTGMGKVYLHEVSLDLNKMRGHINLYGDLITFLSNYKTDGRIIFLPFVGTGILKTNLYNTTIHIKFKLEKYKNNNDVDYIRPYAHSSSYAIGHVEFRLQQDFGHALDEILNKVMTDNWRELMKEMGPPTFKAVGDKVQKILQNLYVRVPLDEILPP